MKTPVILVVDDEDSIVNSLRGTLEDEGYIVITASDGIRAMEVVQSQPVDMVFLDIWLPGMDGMQTLKAIKDYNAAIDVVMMTGHGTVNTAVQAVKLGAFDFLEKPFSLDTVIEIIKKIKEKQQSSITSGTKHDGASEEADEAFTLTGNSRAVLMLKDTISTAARSKEHILLQGEVGTGKELVARLIHASSAHKDKKLIKFNCAFHITEDIERDLFGSRETRQSKSADGGMLSSASGTTVFIDSIDLIPPVVQKRFCDFLDSSDSGGGQKPRIIAATNKDIEKSIEGKILKKELVEHFDRIVQLPSLRNRRGDVPLLLNLFLEYFCRDYGFRDKKFEDDALEILVNYDWPGNVRELKNLVEKIVVSVPTRSVSAHDIPLSVRDEMQYSMARYYERYRSMEDAESAWRKNYVLYYLRKNDKDIKKTADKIGIKERDLKKYIKEYNIVFSKEKRSVKSSQRTLKRSMVLSGRGLHSGDKTGLIITPMPPNSGIVFGNISSGETIPAIIDFVVSTDYATCLQNTNTVARTIEHFLAVLHAYRITNIMVKINNEVPIMDGSSADFCQIIEDAGIEEQSEILDEIVIKERYTVGEVNKKRKFITIEPSDVFSIDYTLQYPRPVGRQHYTFILENEDSFKKEIAPARTFGFLKDIEALNEKGLASGGRLNNFILIDDEKIVNTDLRFPDEFVRHKILDMMGDLYLLGRPVRGKITANMTGHSENVELVRMIREKMNL